MLLNGILGAGRKPGPLGVDVLTLPTAALQAYSQATPVSGAAARRESLGNDYQNLGGHFTIERHITGLTLREIESKIGYREGVLAAGARIFVFTERPNVGQFVFAGSTRYPNAEGLVSLDERLKAASQVIPGAWVNERLVKIVPVQPPPDERDSYPKAQSPVEQWVLLAKLPVELVCELHGSDRYYPR